MAAFLDTIAKQLSDCHIAYRRDVDAISVTLPKQFGELRIEELADGDALVGLVGSEWHTHPDLLQCYGGADDAEATVVFIKGLLRGDFLMVETTYPDGRVERTIEDDLEEFREDLPSGARVRVVSGSR